MANPYRLPNNTVNLTTVDATEENKSYLVDKRLVDFLLSKVTTADLESIKNDIRTEISYADDKDDLFTRLDNYIYLNRIVELDANIKRGEKPNIIGHMELERPVQY